MNYSLVHVNHHLLDVLAGTSITFILASTLSGLHT